MLAALAPENAGYVEVGVDGEMVRLTVRARSAGELRRTLEDTLACLSAAERTWEKATAGEEESDA